VFVVGHLGDWKPAAEVLFEPESLSGNNQKGRGEKEKITPSIKRGIAYGGSNPDCADTVTSKWAKGSGGPSGNECGLFVAHKVYENHAQDSRVKEVDVCPTVAAKWGMGGGNIPLAMQGNLIGRDAGGPQGIGVSDSNTMYTLTKTDVHAVAYGFEPGITKREGNPNRFTEQMSPTLRAEMGDNQASVAFAQQPIPEYYAHQYCQDRVYSTEGITPALNCSQAHKFRFDMAVRRLTPVECERLQGFPDNYTNIPKAADGNRYKALGNSMAVPVMRWIGERINQYEQRGMEKHL
jgi:DNA (cytosine-5)-methyltransferase 1